MFVIVQTSLHGHRFYLNHLNAWDYQERRARKFDSRRSAYRFMRDGLALRSIVGHAPDIKIEESTGPAVLDDILPMDSGIGRVVHN